MKYLFLLLISCYSFSCATDNYYPEKAFEFSKTQNYLLSLYDTGDTISFYHDQSIHTFIIGNIYEEKHNSYTHFGINRKIERCKWVTYKNHKETEEHSLISCCVAPRLKEKSIDIYAMDKEGFYWGDSLLLNHKEKLELNQLVFKDIFEVKMKYLEKISPDGIETIYISFQNGIIGYKLKNNDLWLSTKYPLASTSKH